jgi:hypothetical protein
MNISRMNKIIHALSREEKPAERARVVLRETAYIARTHFSVLRHFIIFIF